MAKVLVLDDRSANREFLVTLLRHFGHVPIEAVDGAQGLALVRSEHPDLVISDILMPTMDGYEFVRRMRSEPAIAQTQVVFCTAHYHAREAKGLADACGVFRVLVKPCEPDEIMRAVEDALAERVTRAIAVPQEFSREHVRLMADKLAEKSGELRAARQRITALNEYNLQLASGYDPDLVPDQFSRGARELLGARIVVVGIKGCGPGLPPSLYASGIDHGLLAEMRLASVHKGDLGQVLLERRTRRFPGPLPDATAMGLPDGVPSFQFALAAPIATMEEAYGWVCLTDKTGALEFDDEDELFLSSLAAQAGRIYERRLRIARLLSELNVLRTESDRRREAARADAILLESLNANEREIVRLVAAGKTTTEIAAALTLSPRTVETYRARMMQKLGISSLAALVKFAIRSAIIPLD